MAEAEAEAAAGRIENSLKEETLAAKAQAEVSNSLQLSHSLL